MATLTQIQLNNKISRLNCCAGLLSSQVLKAEQQNREDYKCLSAKFLYLDRAIKILADYIPPGTVTISNVDACAILDFASLVGVPLGDGMNILAVYFGPSQSILLCQYTGNYLGFTLVQFLDDIVVNINNGFSGFTATRILNTISICAPSDLGEDPTEGEVQISFPPFYTWLNERDNELDDHGTASPNGISDIGYTSIINMGRPAFVPSLNYLYVPMGDQAAQYTINKDFNGAVSPFVGNPYSHTMTAGFSTFIYTAGTSFSMSWTTYNIVCTVVSYVGTTLTYNIVSVTNSAIPSAAPVGAQNWNFRINSPGFGTVNIYSVNPTTGVIAYVNFIQIPNEIPLEAYYHLTSNCVFIMASGRGAGGSVSLSKIDCTANPLLLTGTTFLENNFGGTVLVAGQNLTFNPLSGGSTPMFYVDTGSNTFNKIDLNLNTDSTGNFNFAVSPFGLATRVAVNPVTGDLYYGRGLGGAVPPIPNNPAEINIMSTNANISTPDTGANLFSLSDYGVITSGVTVLGYIGLYYSSVNQRLFIIRSTTTPNQSLLQSYDISSGVDATINLTKQDHIFPNSEVSGGNMTFQEGIDMLFLNTNSSDEVYVFNPITLTFNSSFVDLSAHNDTSIFSYTNDGVNFNYFGVDQATGWITVIHRSTDNTRINGDFEGEVTTSTSTDADNCLSWDPEIKDILENTDSICCQTCCDDTTLTADD